MTYKEIRKNYQKPILLEKILVNIYAGIFSPFITKLCLKLKLKPNQVTAGMIITGIIGSMLYMCSTLPLKILGIFFIHLWYIFDLSDGEVARITKQSTIYGKEVDYTAHLIGHPFFTIAMMINVYKIKSRFIIYPLILYVIDNVTRGLILFEDIKWLREPESQDIIDAKTTNNLILFIKWCLGSFGSFPLYVLCFPILILIQTIFVVDFLEIIFIMCIFIYGICTLWELFKWLAYSFKN